MSTKKFLLEEKDIPTAWYNIVADMKNKPLPILNPQTKQPLKEEDLYPLFSKGVSHQEMNTTDTWIEIPDEVRELYKVWRPTRWFVPLDWKKRWIRPPISISRTRV